MSLTRIHVCVSWSVTKWRDQNPNQLIMLKYTR